MKLTQISFISQLIFQAIIEDIAIIVLGRALQNLQKYFVVNYAN